MKLMMPVVLYILAVGATVQTQSVIDTTGPIRQRGREITSWSRGGIGRILPLEVEMRKEQDQSKEEDRPVIDVIITNRGTSNIELPNSPDPGDFEPSDPGRRYTVKKLSIYLSSGVGNGPGRRERVLPGGAELYGRNSSAGSITTLTPGESIRVRMRVSLPKEMRDAETLVARVVLNDETVSTVGKKTVSDENEVGAADSAGYSPEALLAPK